ncbi:hypothetical protein WG922_17955 [Ramlibacter sp. AN1015]|uniref:hypothetical protein n=1 Tax=Ramlibacter sp. AN1015 TaxID=3133428 RepID=UPI0030BD8C6E
MPTLGQIFAVAGRTSVGLVRSHPAGSSSSEAAGMPLLPHRDRGAYHFVVRNAQGRSILLSDHAGHPLLIAFDAGHDEELAWVQHRFAAHGLAVMRLPASARPAALGGDGHPLGRWLASQSGQPAEANANAAGHAWFFVASDGLRVHAISPQACTTELHASISHWMLETRSDESAASDANTCTHGLALPA